MKLYLDFDGVILDTINVTYRILSQMDDIDLTDEVAVHKFYIGLDWKYLLETTPEINNSISNIHKLRDSKLFDISILTHVNSYNEANEKNKYCSRLLPNIEVIPTPKRIKKCDMVNPYNAILVDDFLGNLDLWYENGGIPVKFSDNGRQGKYLTITSLDQLLDMYDELDKSRIKVRKLINTTGGNNGRS